MEGILTNTKNGWIVKTNLTTSFRPISWINFTIRVPSFVVEYSLHPFDIAEIKRRKLSKKFEGKKVEFILTNKIFDDPLQQWGVKKRFAKLDEKTYKKSKKK